MRVFFCLCFVLCASSLSDAEAQTFPSGLVEVDVPDGPERVDVSTLAYFPADVVIRSGQKLRFDHGRSSVNTFDVGPAGGALTRIAVQQSGESVTWNGTLSTPGPPQRIRVEWRSGRQFHSYEFRLTIIPQATRVFELVETTLAGPLTHELFVWSGGTRTLDKPLLVVEGIDGANVNSAASYYALGASLFPLGQAEGADIAILNFGDGGRAIQDNAAVVRRVLRDFWDRHNGSPTGELDVVGVSMGGVVARYALAEMEEDGVEHHVKTFVSMDAPQQGAVIDTELQSFIREEVDAADWPASLARMAGLQLLIENSFDPGSRTEHDKFYAEMEALNGGAGYPVQTQNVGVSFGNASPNPDQAGRWLRIDFDPIGGGEEFVLGSDAALTGPGSLLPSAQTQFRSRAGRGFIAVESERFREPTFIPYDSALDIQPNGASPFDVRLDAGVEGPTFHDQIPQDVVGPLLNLLGYALAPPSGVSISGPSSASGGEDVTYQAATPDPNATYTYVWEWRAFPASTGSDVSGGGVPTARYVTYGKWHTGFTVSSRFVHSFPCGVRGEVRVTATGGGGALTSPVKHTSIDCGGGGGGGDAFAEGGGEAKTDGQAQGSLSLGTPHPNPTSGRIRFDVVSEAPSAITVFDALGRLVYESSVESGSVGLDLSRVPPGLYVARLTSGTDVAVQRFSVSR